MAGQPAQRLIHRCALADVHRQVGKGLVDAGVERVGEDGFLQQGEGALVDRLDGHVGVGVASDDNDGDFGMVVAHLLQHAQPIGIGHAHVGYD